MGKSGGSAKQRVTTYRMGIHLGLCSGPVDAIHEVYVSEKPIGGLYSTTKREIDVNKPDMFGGIKKEGGVQGRITMLPGAADQTLTTAIASKFGATPTTMEGFRGLASIFFSHSPGQPQGFYWIANSPYLRDIWATVMRIPKGWYPEKAAIPRNLKGPASFYFLLDRSMSLSASEFQTIKNAVLSGLDMVEDFIAATNYRIDVGVRFYSAGSSAIERTNCDAADIAAIRSFISSAGQVTGGDVNSAMEFVEDWFTATVSVNFSKRALIFVTDSNTEDSMTAAAAGPAADMLDQSSGVFAGSTAVDMYAINYNTSTTTWTSLLDNTPQDGIPIITSTDESGLTNAVAAALQSREFDANAVHIIMESMTNKIWGMGGSLAQFNLPVWEAAADTIYDEGLGLSMIWNQQSKIEDFVKEVLNHIEGYVYINPRTGLFEIKLIRNDYDPDTLVVLDKTNCLLIDHQIKLYGESINEIVVTWTNPKNEQEETVTLQDPGAIAIQGSIVSDSRNYYGVRLASLAMSLCERDLRAATAPLASATVDTDRSNISLTPGSVCKLNFPEHGISNRIMRVGPVDYGNAKSAQLRLTLVEDVFSTPTIAFEEPGESEFEDPSEEPTTATHTEIVTVPYYVAAQQPGAESLAYPEVYSGALVAQAGTDTRSFELYGEVADSLGNLTWQSLGEREIVARATLGAPMAAEAQTTYDNAQLLTMTQGTGPTIAGLAWIGSGDDEDMEIVAISSFSSPNYVLERGVLDTVPRAWPVGTPIWFTDVDANIMDNTPRSAGETVNYKILPITSLGTLAESAAPIVSETLNERPHQPLRPANAKLNGIGFGDVDARSTDPIAATWSERNRVTENSQILLWGAATVTPEAGQTTNIVVMDLARNVLTTHSGLTGTSFDIPHSSFAGKQYGIVRFESERDGLVSLQGHEFVVQVATVTTDTDSYTMDTDTLTMDNG